MKLLKVLYLRVNSAVTVNEDLKIGIQRVYEDLFEVFKGTSVIGIKTPRLPENTEALVETFRVSDTVKFSIVRLSYSISFSSLWDQLLEHNSSHS